MSVCFVGQSVRSPKHEFVHLCKALIEYVSTYWCSPGECGRREPCTSMLDWWYQINYYTKLCRYNVYQYFRINIHNSSYQRIELTSVTRLVKIHVHYWRRLRNYCFAKYHSKCNIWIWSSHPCWWRSLSRVYDKSFSVIQILRCVVFSVIIICLNIFSKP